MDTDTLVAAEQGRDMRHISRVFVEEDYKAKAILYRWMPEAGR